MATCSGCQLRQSSLPPRSVGQSFPARAVDNAPCQAVSPRSDFHERSTWRSGCQACLPAITVSRLRANPSRLFWSLDTAVPQGGGAMSGQLWGTAVVNAGAWAQVCWKTRVTLLRPCWGQSPGMGTPVSPRTIPMQELCLTYGHTGERSDRMRPRELISTTRLFTLKR